MRNLPSQKGIAIITALLIVALGTITVVAIASRQQLDIHREQNEALIQDARSFANAGERFASALLFMDFEAELRDGTDSLEDDWAQTIPPITIEQMSLQGCIVDMQGRFNLNNVVTVEGVQDPIQYEILRRLLLQLGIAETKREAILDWVDKDVDPIGPEGAEDDYYTSLTPAYRATNALFMSVSELQLVKGFNPAVEDEKKDYELLLPHVAALPGPTHVNVNTATPEVLGSLSEFMETLGVTMSRWDTGKYEDYPECEDIFDLDAEEVTELGAVKNIDPYLFLEDFFNAAKEGAADVPDDEIAPNNSIAVSSSFFQIRVDVLGESAKLTQYSLLQRDPQSGRSRVIFRSRDTL